jgi:hypothetical protein
MSWREDSMGPQDLRHAQLARPKLLERVRDAIRIRHYSFRTEKTYVHWIKRFIYFHDTDVMNRGGRGAKSPLDSEGSGPPPVLKDVSEARHELTGRPS